MAKLSKTMTVAQFDHGYWYAVELKAFAQAAGIPGAAKLRKDELEAAIKKLLTTGQAVTPTKRTLTKHGPRDVDVGLTMTLPVRHYTSNADTKRFLLREAQRLVPGFQRKAGTRYLLNRWREDQLTAGVKLTYGDLVRKVIALNGEKQGPLRTSHGRYMNFVSDFMKARPGAATKDAAKAWKEVKQLEAPKTYAAWAKARGV